MPDIFYYLDVLGLIIAAVYYLVLARFIYSQNRSAFSNQTFSAVILMLGLLSLIDLLIVLNPRPEWLLYFWRIPPAIGAIIVAFFFCFAWVYPQGKKMPVLVLALIFLPAILLAFSSIFTDSMVKSYEIVDPLNIYSGKLVYGPAHLFLLPYEILLILGGVMLPLLKSFKLKGINRQKVLFVSLALFIGSVAGVTFAAILPRVFNLPRFFSLGPISAASGVTMIAYYIAKYKMFIIIPKIAATEILNSLAAHIAVCDTNNNLLYKGVEILEINQEQRLKIIEAVVRRGETRGQRIMIKNKPYVVSARLFKKGGGIIIVLHDLTLVEKEEEKELQIRQNLEERLEKEKILREIFKQIASDVSLEGVANILASAKATFKGNAEAYRSVEEMAKLTKERNRLFFDANKNRQTLEKKLAEIKKISEESVQKELRMATLKEQIKKSKNET